MDILKNKVTWSIQQEILESCEKRDLPLADALKEKGLTYDSLRYRDYPGSVMQHGRSEILDDEAKLSGSIPAISFFSGAGGLNIGFEHAGFENLVSIEINEVFCNTLRHNSPHKTVIGPPDNLGNIRDHEQVLSLLENIIGTSKPFEGVFHGGPPCQPFSIAANQRFSKNSDKFKRQGFNDEETGELLFDYLWFIELFRPRAFLIENVSGITDCDSDGKIKAELDKLANHGYEIAPPRVVNAAHFGVPQNRMRWIIIGTCTGKPVDFPEPDAEVTPCSYTFSRDMSGVENHQTRKHSAGSIRRYMQLGYGARDKLGRVDRLDPNIPSKTVVAGGTKGGGRSHLHPYAPRTISVRECARLQTFPDHYVFTGSTARQFTQVGNAVPPLLAYKIAKQIRRGL
ncbi:MAG: DNA cytosine methyltransferase [Clostridiales bacterium]|nr:DNA cytosine methyltransferase [Clostridiales bacterium]